MNLVLACVSSLARRGLKDLGLGGGIASGSLANLTTLMNIDLSGNQLAGVVTGRGRVGDGAGCDRGSRLAGAWRMNSGGGASGEGTWACGARLGGGRAEQQGWEEGGDGSAVVPQLEGLG